MPTLTREVLHEVTAAIFRATGAPDDLSAQVADVLVDNHLAGHDSHGILRIPEYVRSVHAGEIVPTARPQVIEESATSALIRGNWAFGQVTGVFAADLADREGKERAGCRALGRSSGPHGTAGGLHRPRRPAGCGHVHGHRDSQQADDGALRGIGADPGDQPHLPFRYPTPRVLLSRSTLPPPPSPRERSRRPRRSTSPFRPAPSWTAADCRPPIRRRSSRGDSFCPSAGTRGTRWRSSPSS